MLLRSPAKLNLGLSIVGRDARGYHLIESLFWPITLEDRIEIQPAERVNVSMEWNHGSGTGTLPNAQQNLVTRACHWADVAGAAIHIQKSIPLGAGLGGGSSNAATVLRHLKPELPPATTATLGADVPFFMAPRPTWVTGIGERLEPLNLAPRELPSWTFLLILPERPIATAEIFNAYRQSLAKFSRRRTPFDGSSVSAAQIREYLSTANNDLEPTIVAAFPEIANILQRLRDTPCLYAGISGTGSACFAIYEENIDKEVLSFCRFDSCRSVLVHTYSDE